MIESLFFEPEAVVKRGWTATQTPGESNCFRFIRLPPGRTTAFIDSKPNPSLVANPHSVQSLSLPPESRTFGRADETWLNQVIVKLSLVQTHPALHSPHELRGLEFLQSNVKLGKAEVDAVYLGVLRDGTRFLVSCEMKGPHEVLDQDQIERGAELLASTSSAEFVVPMGVQALPGGLIWMVEFDPAFPPLNKVSEQVYRLCPAVEGIG